MHAQQLVVLQGRIRVRPAEPVPDLSHRIVGTATRSPWVWLAGLDLAHVALVVVAVSQLVLAAPLFIVDGVSAHASRELAAFSVAFGAGLLVVVAQPRRAAGLLPMAGVLVLVMVAAGLADLATGAATATQELMHVSELVGLAGLWSVARRQPDVPRHASGVLS